MVSNDCKEKCRDFGMLVENIICMADCYEEPIEKFRKSMFYKPEFEDKEKIILDMIDTSNRVSEEIKLLSIEDLKKLQDEYGIELIGYTDMLATALNLLQVLENRLYKMSSKEIGFEEFDESLKRISEMVILLKKYSDKKDAVKYLMEQTGLSEQECSFAYDFFITMFDKKYYYR